MGILYITEKKKNVPVYRYKFSKQNQQMKYQTVTKNTIFETFIP